MTHAIVGVCYIGNKPSKADNIAGTRAVWVPDQVHNFAAPLAKALLAHKGVFAKAQPSADGETFMSGSPAAAAVEPVAYINLNAMDAAALAVYARHEFNRVVQTEGRPVEDVRAEVHRLMATENLDALAQERLSAAGAGSVPYTLAVSQSEYDALIAGELQVKLMPVRDKQLTVTDTLVSVAQEPAAALDPTLDELLDSLDKPALLELAEQEKIQVDAQLNTHKLRNALRKALKG